MFDKLKHHALIHKIRNTKLKQLISQINRTFRNQWDTEFIYFLIVYYIYCNT